MMMMMMTMMMTMMKNDDDNKQASKPVTALENEVETPTKRTRRTARVLKEKGKGKKKENAKQ